MPYTNAHVTVGPIIGKVTHNSARILVEFDREDTVVCSLKSHLGDIITCTLQSKANIPVVFTFNNLNPKTHYRVILNCLIEPIASSFFTLREHQDNSGVLNVAVVSCNETNWQYSKPEEFDLWGDLVERVNNHEIDYIFHIGDQCFMDTGENEKSTQDPYHKCRYILNSTSKDKWETEKPLLLEILRDKYRKTWTYKSMAEVLANVPNLMICDDHEFRDDWGFKPDDYTPGTVDWYYGQLARQVYYEYQRQLREDIDWDNMQNLEYEYFDEIINGVGVSFMEYRGCRSWFREADLEETHLGKDQANWIYNLYREHGKFDMLNTTLFITPLPLFFISHFYSHIAYLKENDIKEHWTYNSVPQLVSLLNLLRKWKSRDDKRDLMIVGGEVRLGGWTDVYYKDEVVLRQFISSAVNGKVATKIEKAILELAQKDGKLNEDYFFRHHDWIRENNYGLIRVKNVNGVSSVDTSLICIRKKK